MLNRRSILQGFGSFLALPFIPKLPPRKLKPLEKPRFLKPDSHDFIQTGFPVLDEALGGGLLPGSLFAIIGACGSGKSAFANSIHCNYHEQYGRLIYGKNYRGECFHAGYDGGEHWEYTKCIIDDYDCMCHESDWNPEPANSIENLKFEAIKRKIAIGLVFSVRRADFSWKPVKSQFFDYIFGLRKTTSYSPKGDEFGCTLVKNRWGTVFCLSQRLMLSKDYSYFEAI